MDAAALMPTAESTPLVEVVIEIPRGSFRKVGSTGHTDFLSPVPCPFNYEQALITPMSNGDRCRKTRCVFL